MPEAETVSQLKMVAWLVVEDDDLSMTSAIQEAIDAGNEILEVDEADRRIKVAEVTIEQEN